MMTTTNPPSRIQETLFSNGADYFQQLIYDLETAQHSIDFEVYIFQNSTLGDHLTQALCDAAHRGVKVRVMVDGAGSPLWGATYANSIESAGGETRIYHPFPWQLWNYSRSLIKLPFILKWIYLLLKINKRNHRKLCMIDQHIVYIGSINITPDHLPKNIQGSGWRDIAIRIKNANLDSLQNAFECAWLHRPLKERIRDAFKAIKHNPVIRLNHSWLRRRILYKQLLRRINLCKHRIWITNAYFVPDNFLLRKLIDAAKRGIDVRILLAKKSDIFMMPWASSAFYHSLLKAGVRIFEYLPSNLHAKTLIIDRWMLIGSSNLNHRSLLHDLEVDVNIRRYNTKKQLAKLFLEDLKQSREIELNELHKQRPWYQRLLGRVILYMKYWI
jgi:cardiolipin synthase